jgi:hypothetical protein
MQGGGDAAGTQKRESTVETTPIIVTAPGGPGRFVAVTIHFPALP